MLNIKKLINLLSLILFVSDTMTGEKVLQNASQSFLSSRIPRSLTCTVFMSTNLYLMASQLWPLGPTLVKLDCYCSCIVNTISIFHFYVS